MPKTMKTFKDHLAELTTLQHERAIWNEMLSVFEEEYLTYEGDDGEDEPGREIKAPGCAFPVVSEDAIEDFAVTVRGKVATLDKTIEEMEGRKVS